jgi:mandelate racemase
MVDYNQSLTVPEAIRRIDYLEDFDLEWVEEPVPAEDFSGHATVRAAVAIPIQTGENWWFAHDTAEGVGRSRKEDRRPRLIFGALTGSDPPPPTSPPASAKR